MWITTNCRQLLKEMGIPDRLTCLLRNLYAGQEATVRTEYGTRTGSKLGKDYVHWSRDCECTDHVADHAQIT